MCGSKARLTLCILIINKRILTGNYLYSVYLYIIFIVLRTAELFTFDYYLYILWYKNNIIIQPHLLVGLI